MALIKNLFLFAILVSSRTIFAQDTSSAIPPEPTESTDVTTLGPDPDSSDLPIVSAATGTFGHFAFQPPQFDFNWPQIPDIFGGSSRQKRSPADTPDAVHARQEAAFFRRVIRCNFLTEGGTKCLSCNTVRRCYPFNFGSVSTCSGLFPYCNNGQCSRTKGPLCKTTTTTTTATSSTSESTTASDTSSSTASNTDPTTTPSSTSSSSTASTSTTPA